MTAGHSFWGTLGKLPLKEGTRREEDLRRLKGLASFDHEKKKKGETSKHKKKYSQPRGKIAALKRERPGSIGKVVIEGGLGKRKIRRVYSL